MRNANCPGLLDAVLAETIPMHGRMIHGAKHGKIFEESQAYDIHGRVGLTSSDYSTHIDRHSL
jgi:kynurenine 3-monooxygenase